MATEGVMDSPFVKVRRIGKTKMVVWKDSLVPVPVGTELRVFGGGYKTIILNHKNGSWAISFCPDVTGVEVDHEEW